MNLSKLGGGRLRYQNHDFICICSTYIFDKVKTSHFRIFLQVLARSACMFLAFIFFFAKFFFQKSEFGNGVTKIGNGVTKIWILVTYAPYTPTNRQEPRR